ncbi:MAG: TSUP family transporter [Planctomycetia bacterium]
MPPLLPLLPFILLGAALYASVGHGGATIYLAILTLAGVPTGSLATTVLALNILAAAIGFQAFARAGHLRLDLLLPLVLASVPMAYLGGRVPLSGPVQAGLLAGALALGGLRLLLLPEPRRQPGPPARGRLPASVLLGALLGFLAGATGIGGGIFLSPVLFLLGWATVKEAAAVASAFIVLNSAAGLAARLPREPLDPDALLWLGAAVLAGALAGSALGARRLPPRALQLLLGVVLLVAAVRAVQSVA